MDQRVLADQHSPRTGKPELLERARDGIRHLRGPPRVSIKHDGRDRAPPAGATRTARDAIAPEAGRRVSRRHGTQLPLEPPTLPAPHRQRISRFIAEETGVEQAASFGEGHRGWRDHGDSDEGARRDLASRVDQRNHREVLAPRWSTIARMTGDPLGRRLLRTPPKNRLPEQVADEQRIADVYLGSSDSTKHDEPTELRRGLLGDSLLDDAIADASRGGRRTLAAGMMLLEHLEATRRRYPKAPLAVQVVRDEARHGGSALDPPANKGRRVTDPRQP